MSAFERALKSLVTRALVDLFSICALHKGSFSSSSAERRVIRLSTKVNMSLSCGSWWSLLNDKKFVYEVDTRSKLYDS